MSRLPPLRVIEGGNASGTGRARRVSARPAEVLRLEREVAELERLLGRQALEIARLRAALARRRGAAGRLDS